MEVLQTSALPLGYVATHIRAALLYQIGRAVSTTGDLRPGAVGIQDEPHRGEAAAFAGPGRLDDRAPGKLLDRPGGGGALARGRPERVRQRGMELQKLVGRGAGEGEEVPARRLRLGGQGIDIAGLPRRVEQEARLIEGDEAGDTAAVLLDRGYRAPQARRHGVLPGRVEAGGWWAE